MMRVSAGLERARIGALWETLKAWWLREFLYLFPTKTADWLMDAGSRTLLLQPSETGTRFLLRDQRGVILQEASITDTEDGRRAVYRFLQQRGLAPNDVALGLGMPPGRFFQRQILLPREAKGAIAAVTAQDLVRKTPFRLGDVYHGHIAQDVDNKIAVTQLVVRREFVEDAARSVGMPVDAFGFIEMAPAAGRISLGLRLQLRPQEAPRRWLPTALAGLSIVAVSIAVLAVTLEYRQQQVVLDELASQIAMTRAQAQQVRSALDKIEQERATLEQLRSRKWNNANMLDIWDELSRVLPDHSWLTEMRLSESPEKKDRKIIVTGFSAAAADLVALIDRSPLFHDVALVAPIALDLTEQRERFVLQATVGALNTARVQ